MAPAVGGVTGAGPEEAGRRPDDAAPSPLGLVPAGLSPTGLTSFEWDTVHGSIRTDPMGERLRGWPPPSPGRPEHEVLLALSPSQVESLAHRARAAQATGTELDAQVWTTGTGGYGRLLWIRGRREPAADPEAPLIGAIVDITDLAHSLAVTTSRSLDAHPGPPRVGRISWDEKTGSAHLTAEAASLLGLTGGGAHPADVLESALTSSSYADLVRHVRAARVGDVVDVVVQTARTPHEHGLHLRALVSGGDVGGTALIGTITDAGDEIAARQSVINVSRALTTLSRGNHVLAMATDEEQMLRDVCTTIVTDGGYHFAWYGRASSEDGLPVVPVAYAGYEAGYLSEMRFSWSEEDPAGRGPSGQAIRSGEVRYAHLVASHPGMEVWRTAALERGYVSTVALPVRVDGVVDGALMVYATEPTAFDATEIGLLSDLALGIGTGLSRLADMAALEATSRRSEASSRRLQATLDSLLDPFVLLEAVRDEDGVLRDLRHIEANEAAAAYTHCTREEFLGTTLTGLYPGLDSSGLLAEYFRVVETGAPMIIDDVEYANEILGEARRYDLRGVRCGDGLALTWRDVTSSYVARQQIADSERRYRLLAENATDVVALLDTDRCVLWASPSLTAAAGWLPAELVGRSLDELVHPDDHERVVADIAEPGRHESSFRLVCSDATHRWMSATGRWALDEHGERVGYVVALRDIDVQVRAQRELAEREQRYRLLAENASDVVLQVGPDGRIRWASESVSLVLGWNGRDILGRVATELVHPDDRPLVIDGLADDLQGRTSNARLRILRPDGESQWMSVTAHQVRADDGDFRVLALRDIADAVRAQDELEHAVGHDPLTGLANRSTVLAGLRDLLDRLPAEDSKVGALSIGIDGLTSVNEALTHEAGDQVLVVVAARVASALDAGEVVGRGAGDEFVVVLPELDTGPDAAVAAERVRLAVHGPIVVGAHQIQPTVSIGIAIGDRSSDPESLLRDAGLAMRQAKSHGRDRSEFVDPHLAKEASRRLLVDGAIRDALRRRELVPMFQPIVSLADDSVAGYEALVRWIRPDGTTVEPYAFLPVAERTSLITDIDVVILRRSVDALRRLPDDQWVAVNVSAASLARSDYADDVVDALRAAGVDPARLHLEVTETAVVHVTEEVRSTMRRLAEAGIRWYMDDFGTGYSSISHLRDLPIAGIKLDRSFTAEIVDGDEESTSDRLAQALAGLAVGLGLDTVAEGVETRTQAERLASYGWVHGQGWLYGKAAPLP